MCTIRNYNELNLQTSDCESDEEEDFNLGEVDQDVPTKKHKKAVFDLTNLAH